jgi:hypothetical protein
MSGVLTTALHRLKRQPDSFSFNDVKTPFEPYSSPEHFDEPDPAIGVFANWFSKQGHSHSNFRS